ncbi:hypothetical protein H072_9767 [Dactylellina haptotyla CBS 200.50]|uniref:F-box domain-containing protein n=1 Tax=Dactylellina haptotyla (strain CBS 200.50) TaxID=1284197 RepID=S8A0Z1_DACHA|nr:hypothetical protein H072_9767 [Dactylellina haptotyla CBS 200.50]
MDRIKAPFKAYLSKFTKKKKNEGSDGGYPKRGKFDIGLHLHLTTPTLSKKIPKTSSSIKKQVEIFKSIIRNFKVTIKPNRPPKSPIFSTLPVLLPTCNGATKRRFRKPKFETLHSAVLIKIFQWVPYESLPTLLAVNHRTRKIILDNYPSILSYPNVITSRYEWYPLNLRFPRWWVDYECAYFYIALNQAALYEDCFQVAAVILAEEFLDFWESLAARVPRFKAMRDEWIGGVQPEDLRDELLAELVREVWKRGLKEESAIEYTEKLIPPGYEHIGLKGRDNAKYNIKGKGKDPAYGHQNSRSPSLGEDNDSEDLFMDGTAAQAKPIPLERNILYQAIRYALHPTVLEDIAYSFPYFKLERLHPIQIIELILIKVPAWSWKQEDRILYYRICFEDSPKALEEMDRIRYDWDTMRDRIKYAMKAKPV